MRAASRSSSSEEMRETSPPSRAATAFSVEPSKNVSTRCRSAERRATSSKRSLRDRKSTRLNSSHGYISYAVFCLKKKKKEDNTRRKHRQLGKMIHKSPAHSLSDSQTTLQTLSTVQAALLYDMIDLCVTRACLHTTVTLIPLYTIFIFR